MPLVAVMIGFMAGGACAMMVDLPTAPILVLSALLQQPLSGAQNGPYRPGWVYSGTAHIRGYYRLLAHPTSFLGQWHPIGLIRWGEAMRG